MSNKNISQFSPLTDTNTGDYLLLYDASASLTYRVFVNDIVRLTPVGLNQNNHFQDILVDRYAWISGIIGGATGTHILSGQYGGILGGTNNVVSGRQCVVGGGNVNTAKGFASMVGAGASNQATGDWDFIGAGRSNLVEDNESAVVAGSTNTVSEQLSIIGAGSVNKIKPSTWGAGRDGILAGRSNEILGDYCVIVGGDGNIVTGQWDFQGGGASNIVTGDYVTSVGGKSNIASGTYSFLGAGLSNAVRGPYSLIVGGTANVIFLADKASIIGGDTNRIGSNGTYSIIGGGVSNLLLGNTATLLGGDSNKVTGDYASLGGGYTNVASGNYSVVPGGRENNARGSYSLAAGRQSIANHPGSFVFSDSRALNKVSAGQDTLTCDFSGGAWITGGGLNARMGFNLFPTGVTPTSSIGGRSGDFAYKDDYLYVFTGDNADLSNKNWGRIQLSTLNGSPPSVVANDSSIVHVAGNPYSLSDVFAPVSFVGGTDPIITIPAGMGTYEIECVFGACKGSTSALTINYFLYNTSDSRMIPNTSGERSLIASFGTPSTQYITKTITGVNYGAAKSVQLYAKTTLDGDAAQVIATGSWISYTKLA